MNTVSLSNNYNMNRTVQNNFSQTNVRKLNNDLACDTVSFTGKKKSKDVEGKKKSGFIHKALVATVGCAYPGLGQAINGQWGKAALVAIGTPVLALTALMVNPLLVPLVIGVAEIGAFVDAYRNA